MDGAGSTITENRRGAVSVGGASMFVFPVVQLLSVRRLKVFVIVPQHRRTPDWQTSQTLQTQETLFQQRQTVDSQSLKLQEMLSQQEHPLVWSLKLECLQIHPQKMTMKNTMPNKDPLKENSSLYSRVSDVVMFRISVVVSMLPTWGLEQQCYNVYTLTNIKKTMVCTYITCKFYGFKNLNTSSIGFFHSFCITYTKYFK